MRLSGAAVLGSQPGVARIIKVVGMEPSRDSEPRFNSSPDAQRTGIPQDSFLSSFSPTKEVLLNTELIFGAEE